MTASPWHPPVRLAFATALLPLLAVHACYLLAASLGHVEWCIPYLDGCSSISKTGRRFPEYLLFKATMIPAALLMILYWRACGRWLQTLESVGSRSARSIPVLGLVSGGFLIVYTVALGHHGDEFRLLRRLGVILHFSTGYLAALLLTARVQDLWRSGRLQLPPGIVYGLWACCSLVLLIGLVHLVAEALDPAYDSWEDAVEWNVALFINLHYFLVARMWQVARSVRVGVESAAPN